MPAALLIHPDSTHEWITLAYHADVTGYPSLNNDLRARLNGDIDFATIARNTTRRGVQIAVHEWSLTNGSPHNTLASNVVNGAGRDWHVHGPAVLLGLNYSDTADLTIEQWADLIAQSRPTTTECLTPGQAVPQVVNL